jgi:hypothetical protein
VRWSCPGFRRRVGGEVGVSITPGVRHDGDDAPPGPFDHAGKGTAGAVHDAEEVDADVTAPLARVRLGEGPHVGETLRARIAGVVDEDVDAAVPERGLYRYPIGHVEGGLLGRSAEVLDLLDDGSGAVGHHVVDENSGAGLRQRHRDGPAHTLSSAGHQRARVLEVDFESHSSRVASPGPEARRARRIGRGAIAGSAVRYEKNAMKGTP